MQAPISDVSDDKEQPLQETTNPATFIQLPTLEAVINLAEKKLHALKEFSRHVHQQAQDLLTKIASHEAMTARLFAAYAAICVFSLGLAIWLALLG